MRRTVPVQPDLISAVDAVARRDRIPFRHAAARLLALGLAADRAQQQAPPPAAAPPAPDVGDDVLRVILRDLPDLMANAPRGLKTQEILRCLYPPRGPTFDALRSALETIAPPLQRAAMPDARSLGRALSKLLDRAIDGRRITARSGGGAALRWLVTDMPASASPADRITVAALRSFLARRYAITVTSVRNHFHITDEHYEAATDRIYAGLRELGWAHAPSKFARDRWEAPAGWL